MYGQRQYGWGDAIGQIMGAVMQRNQQREESKNFVNMLGDASKFGTDTLGNLDFGGKTHIEDQASRLNGGNYMNKNNETKIAQGLLPTGFQTTTPNTNMVGQGLSGGQGMLSGQKWQQPKNFFVGPNFDDPDIGQQPAIAPAMGQYAKENNPANVSVSAPKTLAQQKAMMMGSIPAEIKRIMGTPDGKNYNPRDLYALLKQQADTKFTEQEEVYKNQQYDVFEAEKDPRKKIMVGMKSGIIGKEGAMMLVNPEIETKVIKRDGGQHAVVGFNRLTGKYVDLKDGSEISPEKLQEMLSPTLTPGQQADEVQRQYMRDNPRVYGGGGGRTGGKTSSGKLGKEENWALGYESGNGLTNDTALIEGLSSLDTLTTSQQIQLDKALGRRDHYWKVSSGGQYGAEQPAQQEQSNPGGAEWYYRQAEEIKAANPDATMEEIEAFMTKKINRG